MIRSVGTIEFFDIEDSDPMVRLMVEDMFHDLSPIEQVRFLIAASQVAFAAASTIADQNPEYTDEIAEMMQSIELEPTNRQLN